MTEGEWIVRVDGDPSDLDELAETLAPFAPVKIVRGDDFYTLTFSGLADLQTASAVRESAREWVPFLNGAAALRMTLRRPLAVDAIARRDTDGSMH